MTGPPGWLLARSEVVLEQQGSEERAQVATDGRFDLRDIDPEHAEQATLRLEGPAVHARPKRIEFLGSDRSDQRTLAPIEAEIRAPITVLVDIDDAVTERWKRIGGPVIKVVTRSKDAVSGRALEVESDELPLQTDPMSHTIERSISSPATVRVLLPSAGRPPWRLSESVTEFDLVEWKYPEVRTSLDKQRFVVGSVTTEDGTPLVGSIVSLRSAAGRTDFLARRSSEFVLLRPAGEFTVTARFGSAASESISSSSIVDVSDLALVVDTNELIGVDLTEADGTPIEEYWAARSPRNERPLDPSAHLVPTPRGRLYLKHSLLRQGTRLYFLGRGFAFAYDIPSDWHANATYHVTATRHEEATVTVECTVEFTAEQDQRLTVHLQEMGAEAPADLRVPLSYWTRNRTGDSWVFERIAHGQYEARIERSDRTIVGRQVVNVYSPNVTFRIQSR